MIKHLILILALVSCSTMTKNKEHKPREISWMAVKGSVHPILNYFNSDKNLSPEMIQLKKQYQDRFIKKEIPQFQHDDLSAQVIRVFQSYWTKVLLDELDQDSGFKYLYGELNKISIPKGKDFKEYSKDSAKGVSDFLKQEILKDGYNSLWGLTRPHAELMVWKSQEAKSYEIDLIDTKVTVEVELLDDFISFGWLGYATFDDLHNGGWATKEKLFCVSTKYDLDSESYKVSYLAHEGRHFSDYQKFPNLEGTDLEYRAKLTELILAEDSFYDLISKFDKEKEANRNSSHAYASFVLIERLKEKLKVEDLTKVGLEKLKIESKKLLEENSNELIKADASKVKTVI